MIPHRPHREATRARLPAMRALASGAVCGPSWRRCAHRGARGGLRQRAAVEGACARFGVKFELHGGGLATADGPRGNTRERRYIHPVSTELDSSYAPILAPKK